MHSENLIKSRHVDKDRRHYLKACLMSLLSIPLMAQSHQRFSNGVSIEDALRRVVHIDKPPQRIVSIFASNTELLHALGATNRIVGIEDYTHFPPNIRDGRTIVGGRLGFSVETIARLEPDLVITTPARQAVNILLEPMEIIGVPVIVLLHRTVDEIFDNLRLLGTVLGEEAHADHVVHALQQRLETISTQLKGVTPKRVYFETGLNDRGNFTTVRPGSYTCDAIEQAGGVSIFPDLEQVNQVSGEAIISADPEIIFVARNQGSVDSIKNRPGWQNIQAVRDNNVFFVPRELFLIPGPRIVDGVEYLLPLLHPIIYQIK